MSTDSRNRGLCVNRRQSDLTTATCQFRLIPIPPRPLWTLCDASESCLRPLHQQRATAEGRTNRQPGLQERASADGTRPNVTPVRGGPVTSKNECCASVRNSEPLCAKTRCQANVPKLGQTGAVGALMCSADNLRSQQRCRLVRKSPSVPGTDGAQRHARGRSRAAWPCRHERRCWRPRFLLSGARSSDSRGRTAVAEARPGPLHKLLREWMSAPLGHSGLVPRSCGTPETLWLSPGDSLGPSCDQCVARAEPEVAREDQSQGARGGKA